MRVIQIDGSMLEGGGQILRNGSALAAITGQAIQVDKIRAGRAKPGLAPQHLTGLQLVTALAGGTLTGGQVRSTSIGLQPGLLVCGSYTADTQTAGSCTLLAQSALPVALYAAAASPPAPSPAAAAAEGAAAAPSPTPSPAAAAAQDAGGAAEAPQTPDAGGEPAAAPTTTTMRLLGGTDADMAPPVAYLQHVLLPLLRSRLGIEAQVELVRRGFYPKGGGILDLTVQALPSGSPLPPLDLTDRGSLTSIDIRTFAAGRVAPGTEQRLAAAAAQDLRRGLVHDLRVEGVVLQQLAVRETPDSAFGNGAGMLLVAHTSTGCRLAASAKGEAGVAPEATAAIAAGELLELLAAGACVDEHLADQLVIFMALARGSSRMLCGEPSLHTRTAMVLAQQLLPGCEFTLTKHPGPAPPPAAAAGESKVMQEAQEQGPHQEAAAAAAAQGGRQQAQLYVISCVGAGWVAGMRQLA